MIFNKSFQHAFLICLYLARAGRADAKAMSINLSVSLDDVKKTLRVLKKANYVTYRADAGYKLRSKVRVYHIYQLYSPPGLLGSKDFFKYSSGEFENRALALYAKILGGFIFNEMTPSFAELGADLARLEHEQFKDLEKTLEN